MVLKPKKIVRSDEYYLKRIRELKSDVEELDLAGIDSDFKASLLVKHRAKLKENKK